MKNKWTPWLMVLAILLLAGGIILHNLTGKEFWLAPALIVCLVAACLDDGPADPDFGI